MKKGSGTKERISITVDKKVLAQINKDCEKNLMKVSSYVEALIKKGLGK